MPSTHFIIKHLKTLILLVLHLCFILKYGVNTLIIIDKNLIFEHVHNLLYNIIY